MPFTKDGQRVPTSIGRIVIILTDDGPGARAPGAAPNPAAEYSLEVLDAGGAIMRTLRGDLLPLLTTAQSTSVLGFLQAMRAKAVAEVL